LRFRKIIRIPWTSRVKNNDILTFLNIKESWLVNNILARKLKYYGHVKRHSGMGRYVMEDNVPGIRGRSRTRKRRFQDIKEILKITSDEVGVLARDRNSFRRAMMRAKSWQETGIPSDGLWWELRPDKDMQSINQWKNGIPPPPLLSRWKDGVILSLPKKEIYLTVTIGVELPYSLW
jgi:hypothetical protein